MIKKFLAALFVVINLFYDAPVFAVGITRYAPFMTADYWTDNNPRGEDVLLSGEQLTEYNAKIRAASPTVVEMVSFPDSLERDWVQARICDFSVLNEELFLNGKAVSENYKIILKAQCNSGAIPEVGKPRFGVIVRRTGVRTLPTAQPLYYYQNDTNFDALQETMLEPGEPVVVLHTSQNGYLYFVQAGNYYGWVTKYNVGLCSRDEFLQYANPGQFVVVTDEHLNINAFKEDIFCQMGCRLPYVEKNSNGYVVLMPGRGKNDKLITERVTVSAGIHDGYLPYTGNNILRLALKFNGKPYGWGGLNDSVDNSGLIYAVYRTMGVLLPRNGDEQQSTYGTHYDFSALDHQQRLAAICQLQPGMALFLEGHCLIYVGKSADVPFAIHALASNYQDGQRQKIMQVVMSDLSLKRVNGRTYVDELTQAVEYH